MSGFEERKIGDVVFLVFADGMVPAADVAELRRESDRFMLRFKTSGWTTFLKPLEAE